MSKKKPAPSNRANKNTEVSMVRSSAAEYLTFVAAGGNSEASVEMRCEDENVWLTQKMMAAQRPKVAEVNPVLTDSSSSCFVKLGRRVRLSAR